MAFRVFVVIWGALVLTLLLFGLLVAALDPAPPKGATLAVEREVVERQLSLVASRDGSDAAMSLWATLAPAHPDLVVSMALDCADTAPIRVVEGACLTVTATRAHSRFLEGLRILVLPLCVGFSVSAAAALMLSHHLTHPIRTVNDALQRLASGDLDTRIGKALHGSSIELTHLGDAFDHAADRLQTLAEGRRALFNDLSHEIRSPLARLRAAVGLLEVSPDRLVEMLRQIETDIQRLDRLVHDILTLARIDSAETGLALERIDLIEILEPILSDANFEGEARGVAVTYEGPVALPMLGNAELLHRAIENVVRNAVAHSPVGRAVAVTAQIADKAIAIDIEDQGPGVSAAEKHRLFEPFFRLPNTASKQGTGLGLAISARAIAAHDGTIELLDNAPSGLKVRVTLALR